jgi:hypothetical protein
MKYLLYSSCSIVKRPDVARTGKGRARRRFAGFSSALLFTFFGCISAMAGPAAPSALVESATETMEARAARLPQGEEFENNGFAYVLLPTLRAEKQKSVRSPLSAGEVPYAGEEFARKGAFRIYHQSVVPSAAAEEGGTPSRSISAIPEPPLHPVVFNKRMKKLGVMTRKLWLKLADMKDSGSIASEYGLKPSYNCEPMQTAFYSAPDGIDLMQLRTRLESDPRVLRVTLETLDRIARPR